MIRIWEKTGIEELEQNLAGVKKTEIKEPEWQTRFRIEYSELKERYNKLHKMLVKHDAGTLNFEPTCPIELLRRQKAVMGEYLNILEIRAEIEKVTL
jgi:hypothetical protein